MSSKLVSKELWPDQWYISDGENTHGPLTAIETFSTFKTISHLFSPEANKNHDHLLVSRKGFSTWYHYKDLQSLYFQGRKGKDSVIAELRKDITTEIDRLKDLLPKTKISSPTSYRPLIPNDSNLVENISANEALYSESMPSHIEVKNQEDMESILKEKDMHLSRLTENDFQFEVAEDYLVQKKKYEYSEIDLTTPRDRSFNSENLSEFHGTNNLIEEKVSIETLGLKNFQPNIYLENLKHSKSNSLEKIKSVSSMMTDDFLSRPRNNRSGSSIEHDKVHSEIIHEPTILADELSPKLKLQNDNPSLQQDRPDPDLKLLKRGYLQEQILMDQLRADEQALSPLVSDLKKAHLSAEQLASQIAKLMARDSVSFASSRDGLSYVNMLAKSRLRLGDIKSPVFEAVKACFWLTLPSLYSKLISEISWHVDPGSSKSLQISTFVSLIPIFNLISFYKVLKVLMTAESQNQYRKISYLWGLSFALFPPMGIFYLQRYANRHWQLHLYDYLKKM